MSYWVGVENNIPDGSHVESYNITWNLMPMLAEAMGIRLRDMDGYLISEVSPIINKAIEAMQENPDKYKLLNPPNNWGSYESALEFLHNIKELCKNYPDSNLYVS